ncbi:MAG TPA: hypothetical protein G4O04_02270 [Anaerolineae bacterium]|nr:hypothetical protein [Anaerolineae bacterium]HID84880.1 hypothetical protein [Anaerolineales bacterium]HIQ09030.1 hypothetical protein [Anaerolineaceae bacterium]
MVSLWRWQALVRVAVLLLAAGVALPFAMVIGWLPSTFLLNFLAYLASVVGLFVGSYGVTLMWRERRRDR